MIIDAALSGLAGSGQTVLQKLLASEPQTAQRTAAITTLAATLSAAARIRASEVLQWTADSNRPPGSGWR